MLRALYPGSFDPPTNGHLNIIQRCSQIFDAIDVVIAMNPHKNYTFSAEERYEMMQELLSEYANVSVHLWDRLVVDFADKVSARVMIRGVRALGDFEYEFELSMLNRGLNTKVETFFIPTDPQYFVLRSTAIKELARLGGDISTMVPPSVADRLRNTMRTAKDTPTPASKA
ncbi:MAG: pantetheine-phosphate adenylyltransferase [Spirochaetaceae bacterium]|nr:MAG: pantetheine-phosphate adenylyltransferase [Spirochaetaceae bacterium]